MEELLELKTINQIKRFISDYEQSQVRERLLSEFDKVAAYSCVSEWNTAVRICEALAIVGWGSREPLQAIKGKAFNGFSTTRFINKYNDSRFRDASWSKRKNGLIIDDHLTSFHKSPDSDINAESGTEFLIEDGKLEAQRNWIPRNPVRLVRHCGGGYESNEEFITLLTTLIDVLDSNLNSANYGMDFNCMFINVAFSSEWTNMIMADDSVTTTNTAELHAELTKIYSLEEIREKGFYLRHRHEIKNFLKQKGTISTTINFEKEFSFMPISNKVDAFLELFQENVHKTFGKLKEKKVKYDFERLENDFEQELKNWKNTLSL